MTYLVAFRNGPTVEVEAASYIAAYHAGRLKNLGGEVSAVWLKGE